MPDERGKMNSGDDIVDAESTDVGSVDDILNAFYGENDIVKVGKIGSDEDAAPSVVKSLDDALRVVDNSGLSPAPISDRPIIDRLPSRRPSAKAAAPAQKTDKYGLPIKSSTPAVWDDLPAVPDAPPDPGSAMVPIRTAPPARASILEAPTAPKQLKGNIGKAEPEVVMPNFNEPDIDKGPDDFKIKFDFESAYKDPLENRPLRRRRERRTGLVGGLMFAVFIMCIALVLASVMWMATMDVLGFGTSEAEIDVYVPADFTMEGITDMLYDAGLIRYKSLFNLFAEYSNAEEKIAPGAYVLNMNYDYRALVQGMTARAGVRVEVTVTIPEGYTLAQIFTLLENEEVCSAEELWDAATHYDFDYYFLEKETLGDRLRLEGFLFPDTYNFYKESTPVRAINRMLREFNNKFTEQYAERADFMGYTIREILTVASMIEREAGSDEERPRIAAVIYNRLNNPTNYPYLEIDATIGYAIAGTGIPWSLQVESKYNTYTHPGLPPSPIANPGLPSIQAALYPMNTSEYFYALNKEGTHNFFKNATDHANFVNSDQYGG